MPRHTADFKLQAASLVLDSNYSLKEAAKASSVSLSAIHTWVKQLREERRQANNTLSVPPTCVYSTMDTVQNIG